MSAEQDPLYLVADIGGTNTRVALARGTAILSDSVRRFANGEFSGLEPILEQYIATTRPDQVEGACVAVAGPVTDDFAELTNRKWTIDRASVARPSGTNVVSVINDLEAQGLALDYLPAENVQTILGEPASNTSADRLVIGVGTGFNCAIVHSHAGSRMVAAAEAGHASLPVRNEDDFALMRFIEDKMGFASVEEVLSGRGLETVYSWQSARLGHDTVRSAAEITTSCAEKSDPVASAAVETFVRILGVSAGNLALVTLPFGGIYLVGGVARVVAPYLSDFAFGEAFRDKGRFEGMMADFAVHVIEDDYAALVGCASNLAAKNLTKSA